MSLALEILEGLWNTTANYKGMPVNVFGFPIYGVNKYKKYYISNTILKLQKNNLIMKKENSWLITEKGKVYLQDRKKLLKQFYAPLNKKPEKDLLIIFDIPEAKKAERQWLRNHLVRFNYFMIQKSVWVGPDPLPKEFLNYLKEIELDSCVKTFKLAKPYKN